MSAVEKKHLWCAVFALFAISGSGIAPAWAITPFYTQTIDGMSEDVGTHTSLVIDAAGIAHIAYYDVTNSALKYTTVTGEMWVSEAVDGAVDDVGEFVSLTLDTDGNPHVCYYDATNTRLRYAVKVDGVWMIEDVDGAVDDVGEYASLALDADGNPHVSYFDDSNLDLKYAVKVGGAWTVESVDTTNIVGGQTSLALDATGQPHVSYLDFTNFDLKYAAKIAGMWTIERVDSTNNVGGYSSLALDAAGNPHVSYHDNDFLRPKYAVKMRGTWEIEMIDNTAGGRYTSLALDDTGNAHVSYYSIALNSDDLKYAVKRDSIWEKETVDAPGDVGWYTSLALDQHGNPHITYYDVSNGDLKYASSAVTLASPLGGEHWTPGTQETVTWVGIGTVDIDISLDAGGSYQTLAASVTGGATVVDVPDEITDAARVRAVRAEPFSSSSSLEVFEIGPARVVPWRMEVSDSAGSVGEYSSIALDAFSRPHASYYDATAGDLKYAVRTATEWTFETVDATGLVGLHTSIAIDKQNGAHVSYYDLDNADLKYATNASGTWSLETVDATGNVGTYTSIALDSQGNPHLTYRDATSSDIKYAAKIGGTWGDEFVDAAATAGGEYGALALDAEGNPHVTFYDTFANKKDLRYAVKKGGVWSAETVDATGDVGKHTSLVVDEDGNPHVSYYDETKGDLKYAIKTDGAWSVETVDEDGMVGLYTSLALDELGRPHITYYDATNLDLKYAVKIGDAWEIAAVDAGGTVGDFSSLALDAFGNPHVSYYDSDAGNLLYATSGLGIDSPAPGTTWPVGATRTVTWSGAGTVDISLSVDGGSTYLPVAENATGGSHGIVVPHTPSLFCRLKIERTLEDNTFLGYYYPASVAEMDSFFTIETEISLLNFVITLPEQGSGTVLSWNTDPGPRDLGGYRVDRRRGTEAWLTLVERTTGTMYRDADGQAGDRYRLYAINGLGEKFYLGETSDGRPPSIDGRLTVWPVPFHSGDLQVRFGVGGFGGVAQATDVAIYDVVGRRVRTVAVIANPTTDIVNVTWDGRDEGGRLVASGVYFIRVRSGQTQHTRKLVIVR